MKIVGIEHAPLDHHAGHAQPDGANIGHAETLILHQFTGGSHDAIHHHITSAVSLRFDLPLGLQLQRLIKEAGQNLCPPNINTKRVTPCRFCGHQQK